MTDHCWHPIPDKIYMEGSEGCCWCGAIRFHAAQQFGPPGHGTHFTAIEERMSLDWSYAWEEYRIGRERPQSFHCPERPTQ